MSRKPDGEVVASCLPPDRAEEIRTQLGRVLSSRQFRGSRRCQNLLKHITEQTLAGDALSLKERTLGIDVFGRPPDYDTGQDPVVRATAAEIRKKLAQYYQDPAHEAEARIEVLAGSYVPEFHLNGAAPAPPRKKTRRPWLIGSLSAVALLTISTAAVMASHWGASALDRFWQPVMHAPGTILVCVGQPVVYNLVSTEAQDNIQAAEGQGLQGRREDVIPRKDLVVLWDRYVALGDAICLGRLAGFFEKHGKPYRIRGERLTSSVDLRENPTVLVAAFDNQWTLRLGSQLRYVFVKDSAHDTDLIRDRQHPDRIEWKLTGAWPHWDVAADYAIVSRILSDPNTDRPVVIAAGITQYGTMAAGEFLSDSEYFAEAAAKLPANWQSKNLQIVLRVPVVHGAAGRPRVLATHTW